MKNPITFVNNVPSFVPDKYVATWDHVASQYERQDVAAMHMAIALKSSGVRTGLTSSNLTAIQDYVLRTTLAPDKQAMVKKMRATMVSSMFDVEKSHYFVQESSKCYTLVGTVLYVAMHKKSFDDALQRTSLIRTKPAPKQFAFNKNDKRRDIRNMMSTASSAGSWYALSDDGLLRLEARRFLGYLVLRFSLKIPKALVALNAKRIEKVWKEIR